MERLVVTEAHYEGDKLTHLKMGTASAATGQWVTLPVSVRVKDVVDKIVAGDIRRYSISRCESNRSWTEFGPRCSANRRRNC